MLSPAYAEQGTRTHAGLGHYFIHKALVRHGEVIVDQQLVTDPQEVLPPDEAVVATSKLLQAEHDAATPAEIAALGLMTRSRYTPKSSPNRQADGMLTDDEIIRRLEGHSDRWVGQELTWKILGVEMLLWHLLPGGTDEDAQFEPKPIRDGLINTGPSPVGSHASSIALLCPRRYAYTYGPRRLPRVHTARVDLLIELANGTILGVDHKTIARDATLGAAQAYNHDVQGTGLRWLLKRVFPNRKTGLMYNFFGTGDVPDYQRFADLPPNPALVNSYERTLVRARETVEQHIEAGAKHPRDWTPTPTVCHAGPHGGCPFRDRCGLGT